MGLEARCTARTGEEVSEGRAHLETDELSFRGAFRLRIPRREIRGAEARDGALHVTYAGGTAVFELGAAAAAWAEKIRNPPALLDKLGVRPGARVSLLGVADPSFAAQLGARGAELTLEAAAGSDLIFLALETPADLDRLGPLQAFLKPDGAIWTLRRKGHPQITEAGVLAAGKAAGLVDVKVARFSDTHTAEKFVIPKSRRGA